MKNLINIDKKLMIALLLILAISYSVWSANNYSSESKEKTSSINKMINSSKNIISKNCGNYFDNKNKAPKPHSNNAYKNIKEIVEDENKELGKCISKELNLDKLSSYNKLQRIFDYLIVNTRYKKDIDDTYQYPSNFLYSEDYDSNFPSGDCEDISITIAFILNNTELDFPFYILETERVIVKEEINKKNRIGHIVVGFNKKNFDSEELSNNNVKYFVDKTTKEKYFLMEFARVNDDSYINSYSAGKSKIGENSLLSFSKYKSKDNWKIDVREWKK